VDEFVVVVNVGFLLGVAVLLIVFFRSRRP
jgi:hypothetical protein